MQHDFPTTVFHGYSNSTYDSRFLASSRAPLSVSADRGILRTAEVNGKEVMRSLRTRDRAEARRKLGDFHLEFIRAAFAWAVADKLIAWQC